MRFALLTGDETAADYRELIANLRDRQQRAGIASTRDALNEDINEALGLLVECETRDAVVDHPA